MALVDKRGDAIEDRWHYPSPADSSTQGHPYFHMVEPFHIIPLQQLVAIGPRLQVFPPAGTLVPNDAPLAMLRPFLDRLDLIAVEFPKFRDGRGFTLARTLRERHVFKGDIRAIGHILPDQFRALILCGFSTVVTPDDHPPEQWSRTLRSLSSPDSSTPLLNRLIGRRALSREYVAESE